MTGRGDNVDTSKAIILNTGDLPFAGRLQASLMLGDLIAAGARWARGHLVSHFAARARHVSSDQPPEPCGAL